MRTIKITSRKKGTFDFIPICNVLIDGKNIAMLGSGKTIEIELDSSTHQLQCAYTYAKYNIERSNLIQINDDLNHNFVVGAVANTYMKRVKENFKTLAEKGYMNVPAIKLYEINFSTEI